jgi:ribonuclease P protein component
MRKKTVLNRQKDFDAVYKKGKSQASRYVVLFYRKNDREYSRISFLASKKVGNSVERHRAVRLMREALRLSGKVISPGYDLILIARKPIIEVKLDDVMHSVKSVLNKTRGVLI